MHRGLKPIYLLVALDAMGIGLVFPTLPLLLRAMLHGRGNVSEQYGWLLGAYAATMFLASPVLGVLSDRMGRRPVLLFSLFGTAFDDLVMALAPTLTLLYAGRLLAGLTGANLTVANAYVADRTAPEDRAKAFGRMNASFGVGFILGPLLGGLAGMISLRAPFYAAAGLNLIGAVICVLALPETRQMSAQERLRPAQLNPFTPLLSLPRLRGVGLPLYVHCTMATVGQLPSVLWVLYGTSRFGWDSKTVGLSFAAFGLLHALCQIYVPDLAQRRLGQRGAVLAGVATDALAYSLFSVVRSSAEAFASTPVLALGGAVEPALQATLSSSVGEAQQGELQGVLTSCSSLVAIVGPVAAAWLYGVLQRRVPGYPGAVWLLPLLLYAPCLVLLLTRGKVRTATGYNEGQLTEAKAE